MADLDDVPYTTHTQGSGNAAPSLLDSLLGAGERIFTHGIDRIFDAEIAEVEEQRIIEKTGLDGSDYTPQVQGGGQVKSVGAANIPASELIRSPVVWLAGGAVALLVLLALR